MRIGVLLVNVFPRLCVGPLDRRPGRRCDADSVRGVGTCSAWPWRLWELGLCPPWRWDDGDGILGLDNLGEGKVSAPYRDYTITEEESKAYRQEASDDRLEKAWPVVAVKKGS